MKEGMDIYSPEVKTGLDSFNEASVRLRIIDPMLTKLGYFSGDNVYLLPEKELSYPYGFIGHKSKKDYPIGEIDYLVGLKGRRGCFVVEAKAAKVKISRNDVEQAHSYAAHAQVGANYFMLCNGWRTLVYETLSGSECDPILEIPIDELDARFHEIENILSPSALGKHCHISYDRNLKLCNGMGSHVVIRSGEYTMEGWHLRFFVGDQEIPMELVKRIPEIQQMIDGLELMAEQLPLRISRGEIKRTEDGRIVLSVKFDGITHSNRRLLDNSGLRNLIFQTDEKYLSCSPESPSLFEATKKATLEKGEHAPVSLFGASVPAENRVKVDSFTRARICAESNRILGVYALTSSILAELPGGQRIGLEFDLFGSISAETE